MYHCDAASLVEKSIIVVMGRVITKSRLINAFIFMCFHNNQKLGLRFLYVRICFEFDLVPLGDVVE